MDNCSYRLQHRLHTAQLPTWPRSSQSTSCFATVLPKWSSLTRGQLWCALVTRCTRKQQRTTHKQMDWWNVWTSAARSRNLSLHVGGSVSFRGIVGMWGTRMAFQAKCRNFKGSAFYLREYAIQPDEIDVTLLDYFCVMKQIEVFICGNYSYPSEPSLDEVSLMLSLAEHVIFSSLPMRLHFTNPIYRGT